GWRWRWRRTSRRVSPRSATVRAISPSGPSIARCCELPTSVCCDCSTRPLLSCPVIDRPVRCAPPAAMWVRRGGSAQLAQPLLVAPADELLEGLRLLVGEHQQRVLGVDDADALEPDQGDVAIRGTVHRGPGGERIDARASHHMDLGAVLAAA